MRVKLTIAYDGTNYHGWQIQPNALSIEEVLSRAIEDLFQCKIKVTGASRTDAGVHALGNVCSFDVDTRMEASKIAFALNQRLPLDIQVQASKEVSDTFHPRFHALEKTYEYRISNRKTLLPTQRFYSYFYHRPLDTNKMQLAANFLLGEHDFTSFSSIHAQTDTFIRTIYECRIFSLDDSTIVIRIRGNGFLYHMVRIIAGTLIKVGIDTLSPDDIPRILNEKNRSLAGPTAPACGLTLCQIRYP